MNKVLHLLEKENIFTNVVVNTKEELLDQLISSFEPKSSEKEIQAISDAVHQREATLSTGIGNGLAIPHGQSAAIAHHHAALAVLNMPIEFDSFDGKPVSIAFLYAGPKASEGSHLDMMGEISRLLNTKDFRNNLLQPQTDAELYRFLMDYS